MRPGVAGGALEGSPGIFMGGAFANMSAFAKPLPDGMSEDVSPLSSTACTLPFGNPSKPDFTKLLPIELLVSSASMLALLVTMSPANDTPWPALHDIGATSIAAPCDAATPGGGNGGAVGGAPGGGPGVGSPKAGAVIGAGPGGGNGGAPGAPGVPGGGGPGGGGGHMHIPGGGPGGGPKGGGGKGKAVGNVAGAPAKPGKPGIAIVGANIGVGAVAAAAGAFTAGSFGFSGGAGLGTGAAVKAFCAAFWSGSGRLPVS
mmetsp:Transcript_94488/g.273124  ORF Transcript_94488/g.273124 Transcript_94488/m.273124 type:complete len:259 (+) Transcript_94488:241-1017(+)